jgi:hypothetical protein
MDIFAHALWTNALARAAVENKEKEKKGLILKLGWTTFWGIFPDLFAFTISFILGIYSLITTGAMAFGRGAVTGGLAPTLYQYSHSLVIWALVFGIVWLIYKRPRWELLGWALHILIDIPSHAGGFYLTPFLFPISDYRFTHGVSWGNPIFMAINYSALLITWGYILIKKYANKS